MTLEEFIAFLQSQIANGEFTGKEIVVRASRSDGYYGVSSAYAKMVFARPHDVDMETGYCEFFNPCETIFHTQETSAVEIF